MRIARILTVFGPKRLHECKIFFERISNEIQRTKKPTKILKKCSKKSSKHINLVLNSAFHNESLVKWFLVRVCGLSAALFWTAFGHTTVRRESRRGGKANAGAPGRPPAKPPKGGSEGAKPQSPTSQKPGGQGAAPLSLNQKKLIFFSKK